jgi:LydA holin phage, holin superfamily III
MSEQVWWTAISNLFSGSVLTLGGAFVGRMMWHGGEVKARRRRMFGRELFWEAPVIFGMWLIANGLQVKLGLGATEANALAVILGYLGPRVIDMAISKWTGK